MPAPPPLKLASPPSRNERDEWVESFEQDFWPEYPRKVSKFAARKVWLRIRPWNQATCDAIAAGLARWVKYWRNHDTDQQFIPYPATWLNGHRWEDEP